MTKPECVFDTELGGYALKDEHGSYILFKDGDIHIQAAKRLFLNIEGEVDAARILTKS